MLVAIACPAVATQESSGKKLSFKSGGHTIRTEWFPSAKGNGSPTVLILHGSGGIEDSGGFFRDMAKDLSTAGSSVVIVHYMDRNGLSSATNAQMSADFSQWMQTIDDAVKFAKKQPGVDPKRIILLGHSLGAQLALHVAATDSSVAGVVVMAGCFVLSTKNITHMPPVLILQGSADRVVTLVREHRLITVLQRCGTKYDEHIFKGADHMFQSVPEAKLFPLIENFLAQH
jgi:dienelactone hydrolase